MQITTNAENFIKIMQGICPSGDVYFLELHKLSNSCGSTLLPSNLNTGVCSVIILCVRFLLKSFLSLIEIGQNVYLGYVWIGMYGLTLVLQMGQTDRHERHVYPMLYAPTESLCE